MRYRSIDDLLAAPRLRLLRALRWFDWVESRDLLAVLEVDADSESRERNSMQVTLGRLVRLGLVERRANLYRVTVAGRCEATPGWVNAVYLRSLERDA